MARWFRLFCILVLASFSLLGDTANFNLPVSTPRLIFTMIQGGALPAPQSAAIGPGSSEIFSSSTPSPLPAWLAVTYANSNATWFPGTTIPIAGITLQFSINSSASYLLAGIYDASIVFYTNDYPSGHLTSQATLPIELIVTAPPANPARTGVLSHMAVGGGWITDITLINRSASARSVTLTFRSDSGSLMTVPVTVSWMGMTQTMTTATVSATINPNCTWLISAGSSATQPITGWADVTSNGPIDGFAILRWMATNGWPLQGSEATVPLVSQADSTVTLPYDNTSGFVMGVSLANLSAITQNVTATIWDDSGNQIGTQQITIPGNGHTSFVLPALMPQTANKRGTVLFASSIDALTGLGFRFSPFGTFTQVPMM